MFLIAICFSTWIGNFVVVDETGREEAVESGRKVVGIVTQVLYYEQVRLLQKSPDWCVFFSFPCSCLCMSGLNASNVSET